ncbi:MAG: hypothetical protein QNJ98_12600 [Planctomycetota bacterium]|nr:hypothetical protein [Planctomycetota bacterium]
MDRRVAWAYGLPLIVLWCALGGGPGALAEEDAKETLVTRIYNVRALTSGRPDFVRVGEPRPIHDAGDEMNPLFGAESEELVFALGQIEHLIEQIRLDVEPASWDTVYGADLRGVGEDTLVVRTFADIADKVAVYLGTLERQALRTVAVELTAVRLTTAQAAAMRSKENPLLVESAAYLANVTAANRGPQLHVLGYERNRFAAHSGVQEAYVADYDVEVAEKAKIADPIVHVHNLGLAMDVRPILAPDASSCLLTLSAFLATRRELRPVTTGDELLIEAPDLEVARLLTKIDIPVNRWALIDGQRGGADDPQWMFLVRVRPMPQDGLAPKARGIALESPPSRPARALVLRSFDIAALAHSVGSTLGQEINLTPSNFTPPAPPELEDPTPIFPVDVIAELMQETVAPATWELKDARIDVRDGRLYVRNAPYVVEAVDRNLRTLNKEFLTSVITTTELVKLPRSVAARLEMQIGPVDGERLAALRAAIAAEEATIERGCTVTNMAGARNAVSSARRMAYLSDYEVEIASNSVIANPIVQEILDGSVLDVRATETAGGGSVHSVVRFTYVDVATPMRTVTTPHGRLEAPALEVLRTRAALRTPIGKTVVVAISGGKDEVLALLLTSRIARSAR